MVIPLQQKKVCHRGQNILVLSNPQGDTGWGWRTQSQISSTREHFLLERGKASSGESLIEVLQAHLVVGV